MIDQLNDASALLAAAESLLRDELAHATKGEVRFKALLSANAVAMARREFALAARLNAADEESRSSIADIRNGIRDDDAALFNRIYGAALLRAYISNPAALNERERSAVMGDTLSVLP